MSTPRILTGIQPSGTPHLGNYLGMIKPAVDLQQKGQTFYFIADYHALTSVQNAKELTSHVHRVALDLLACGLDPHHTVFFRQSAVPEVHELAWYLSTVTPLGLLERCHSYKDKVARGIEASHGLFAYPVLMAADILLYRANWVPVGKDQKQHLEVTRDIALKFNQRFGEVLTMPEPIIREDVAAVPGIDGQKMSKSYGNTIECFAPEKVFRKRVMSIQTDSTPVEAPKPTENSTLLALARALGDAELVASLEADMRRGGVGYGDLKKRLADALWNLFQPFREKRAELESQPGLVEAVLEEGARRARAEATFLLEKVRSVVGTGRGS